MIPATTIRREPAETPFLALKHLALAPGSSERTAFLDNFRPVRLPQPTWAHRLIEAAGRSAHDLKQFSFASLDQLSLHRDPAPLAELIRCISPREVFDLFGEEPLLWAWLNVPSSGSPPSPMADVASRDGSIKRLAEFLRSERGIDLDLLDVVAREFFERTCVVSAGAVWRCYLEVKGSFEEQVDNVFASLRIPRLSTVVGPMEQLREIYYDYQRDTRLKGSERTVFENLFALAALHLPRELSADGMEELVVHGKNVRPIHSILTLIPPQYHLRHLGDRAKEVLLWSAINFSSASSLGHHTNSTPARDWNPRFERLMKFLEKQWGISIPDFAQAQVTAWRLCNGSVDYQVVMKNYELFQLLRSLNPAAIPLGQILERCRLGNWPKEPHRYGVAFLSVESRQVEGAAVEWVGREEPFDWTAQHPKWLKDARNERDATAPIDTHYNWRRFGQTVRCDSPRGIALLHDGYPIAIVSFHIDRGAAGELELTCSATQGVRVELWRARTFQTFPTPRSLGPNYFAVLAEMTFPVAARLGVPWVHQGGQHSNWRDKVSPNRFERRLHDLEIRGHRLSKDSRGNWRLANDVQAEILKEGRAN